MSLVLEGGCRGCGDGMFGGGHNCGDGGVRFVVGRHGN